MEGLPQILLAVIPIYLLMVFGGVLRRTRVLTEQMDHGMMCLVIHILYPALILDKVLQSELLRDPKVVFTAIGLGFLIICLGLAVAFAAGRLIGLRKGEGWRVFTLTTGIQNYGYLAIPLLIVLFSANETEVLGVLFTHSLGADIGIWTVGMIILRGKPLRSPKELISGPIVAVIVGLVWVFSRVDVLIEQSEVTIFLRQILLDVLHWLGLAFFPLALLMVGTAIFDMLGRERFSMKIATTGIVVRLLILPLLILSLAKFVPMAVELKQVLLVQAAMPSAATPIVLARHYGSNPSAGVQVVLSTSLAAIITIPIVIGFGRVWLGL